MGLLAGGVAHDFNNLLTVIRAGVTFLGKGPLTDAQLEDLALVAEAEQSATHLTKKLLMLGHQEPPSFESADLNSVVRDFLRLLERVIPANIQTDFVAGSGLPRLRVDPHQLEQVLMNLALNSRDAMRAGGRLTIETQQVVVTAGPATRTRGQLQAGPLRPAHGVRHGHRHAARSSSASSSRSSRRSPRARARDGAHHRLRRARALRGPHRAGGRAARRDARRLLLPARRHPRAGRGPARARARDRNGPDRAGRGGRARWCG